MNQAPILVILPFIVGVVVSIIFGVRIVQHYSRVDVVLKKWAQDNSCVILHGEIRWLRKGPFLLSADGQTVYYVKVRDENGNIRTGWVRCGGCFVGEWSGKVETRWD